MFETAELGRTVTKEDYAAREPRLRTELLELQTRLKADGKFPLLILINGVDGAGKGETVNLLHEWMDPRFLQAVAFGPPTDEEAARPPFWRYWRALAPRGRTGIYFGNWYTAPIVGRVEREMKKSAFLASLERIRQFEQALVDDGALVVKLWFHLGKGQQQKVYKRLREDKATRWRVSDDDLRRHEQYDRYRTVSEEVVQETSTPAAPWTIIEAGDRRYRELAVGETLVAALSARLDTPPEEANRPGRSPPSITGRSILDTVDLTTTVTNETYQRKLPALQRTLHNTMAANAKQGRSVALVFEGWDAAGKGGAIRRVTEALDARDYRVIPIAAPTDEERAQHYLWRFWRHMPARGKLAIYDRSWYGRVLVERVEGFCTDAAWQRAYSEINEFEEELTENGVVVIKFWLHIDAAEQMKRFKEREDTPFKRFKITEEDWRNREKWAAYERAVHDMVDRTSTRDAPWHLVGANDKYSARLTVLRNIIDRLS
jgi:polyphosphate:AMP phosphotransferase